MDLGTAACPPYHLALVIGGTSAEANLAAVKKHLLNIMTIFLQGNEGGQAFRDLEWEKEFKKFVRNLQSELNLVENI
jgi:fumarate hydratase class I